MIEMTIIMIKISKMIRMMIDAMIMTIAMQ